MCLTENIQNCTLHNFCDCPINTAAHVIQVAHSTCLRSVILVADIPCMKHNSCTFAHCCSATSAVLSRLLSARQIMSLGYACQQPSGEIPPADVDVTVRRKKKTVASEYIWVNSVYNRIASMTSWPAQRLADGRAQDRPLHRDLLHGRL